MNRKRLRLVVVNVMVVLLCGASAAFAQTAPNLGSAQNFAVLSGTASVSNTGPSVLNGDLGTSGVAVARSRVVMVDPFGALELQGQLFAGPA